MVYMWWSYNLFMLYTLVLDNNHIKVLFILMPTALERIQTFLEMSPPSRLPEAIR
jgi:hypothetical protein